MIIKKINILGMENRRRENIISAVLCAFVFIAMLVCTIIGIIQGADKAQPGASGMIGVNFFNAFTTLSNVYLGIACLLILFFNIRNIKNKTNTFPNWVMMVYFVSCAAVALTMITTIVFLGPLYVAHGHNYFGLFKGKLFFFHFLNPTIAIINIMFFVRSKIFNWKHCFWCVLPTILYACVYSPMVLTHRWEDFYGFTFGGKTYMIPISLIVTIGASYLFGFLIALIHNRFAREN